ncbi:hypothetical protein AXE80_08620 [Wenyingzhuangia fucanilytica]|uniref:Imelysin-like domain-containing protein n=1 Tax=Wenyingzhuangia fucanilytica TaxID=1790137 RepID=A0A1B1Y6D8_9FLAO|nr:imelysin family protein [Wenyingzhuangia fucanilytica]ANW96336.1 hypothetical protein AXE80_08620 [Wenyingzhuangia fucanilytica]
MKTNYLKLSLLALTITFTACKKDDNNNDNLEATKNEFIQNYANIVAANYEDTYKTAVTMQTAIDAFIDAPSDDNLTAAKNAWLYARDFYGQTEAFRVAGGPIDNDPLNTEGLMNAWPLDESYIDYVDKKGTPSQTGLIGDTSFTITKENLINKNEGGGEETNISTGWHAIEFLLWGQDLNANGVFTDGGNRPYTDYTTADFAERRKTYLTTVTNLLVKNLKDLKDTWAQNGDYRVIFSSLDQNQQLKNILNGIGFISNGEVAGERIIPAIQDGQENEHSCFSDNTNQDLWANVHGLNNVITGKYTRENKTIISGTSLIDLVETVDTDAANTLKNAANTTLTKLDALLAIGKKFDEIISTESLGSNGPAEQLSDALSTQGIRIAEAAHSMSINISIE